MRNPIFSILIATKNRKKDLIFTLEKINYLIDNKRVDCIVFDDGSTDTTFEYVQQNFPNVTIKRNEVSRGYLYCRNKMLNETNATYAISLDDDAHFVTENPLQLIQKHFEGNQNCGLIAMRIFWGLHAPSSVLSSEKAKQVQGFVGCGHVWRMEAWHKIPSYPEWFKFYGEENFASLQLFKKNWVVHYFPEVLVHHRVDIKARKKNTDYTLRLRRSLRTGWYLLFLFDPIYTIPRNGMYSIWIQLKLKVFKGDFKALLALVLALFDFVLNIPKIIKNSNRLSRQEYEDFNKLPATKIYWIEETK